ncbi:MAG: tRNA lysidine(34) synthetase TilS [Candidatus Aminicenantes bacterium]|nr:tRNA lysidine(34) synthetase TilS [Candidatus Aminicenantes bacterium]
MPPKRRLHPAYRKFRATVLDQGLIRRGDTVLVACSGGPDSMALLHLCLELGGDEGFATAAAHFNHGLRPRAATDERFAEAAALKLDIPYFAGREDVRSLARAQRLGVEEAARLARYRFLERAAAEAGAARLATGHTMNDQAETVLLRLLRGTGPAGLAGIPTRRGLVIVRPILALERREVLSYLADRGIAYRRDETNSDTDILRNRVRHLLIPYLEKRFEPAIVRSLARLARIAGDEEVWLEAAAASRMKKLLGGPSSAPTLDAAALRRQPPALARRMVRAYIKALKGDLRDVSFDDVEAIRALAEGKRLTLWKGLTIGRRAGRLLPG